MPDEPTPPGDAISVNIRVQLQEFKIPPIQDALVLGKEASIGCDAVRRSLNLLHVAPFEHIPLTGDMEDAVVGDVLVRRSLLNKIPREKLLRLILERVKPFMGAEEILDLKIDAEIFFEHQA